MAGLLRLHADRLDLVPLPAAAARCLPGDREGVASLLSAQLEPDWPNADVLGILPARNAVGTESLGIWVMIERQTSTVVGDIGFHGPPDERGAVEIGYSVVASRRRHGYASEAARAMTQWALSQPGIRLVVANCAENNTASIRVLEAAGFALVGADNNDLHWSVAG